MLGVGQAITLITGVATLLTAVAAFLTVREVKRQREASYLPDIVPVAGLAKAAFNSRGGLEALVSIRHPGARPGRETQFDGIAFYNVGLAAAVKIEAEWKTDLASLIEAVNELVNSAKLQHNVRRADAFTGWLEILWEGGPTEVHNIGVQNHFAAPFLLPVAPGRTRMLIPAPRYLVVLHMFVLAFGRGPEVDTRNITPAVLELRYADLGGHVHRKKFRLQLDTIHSMTSSEEASWPSELTARVTLSEEKCLRGEAMPARAPRRRHGTG